MALCRKIPRKTLSLISAVLTVYIIIVSTRMKWMPKTIIAHGSNQEPALSTMHIAVVACEGKSKRVFDQTLTMIKSCVIFSEASLHIHIFTETLKEKFQAELLHWPGEVKAKFKVKIYPIQYPLSHEETTKFKDWWGRCASFRLFLPEVLEQVDSIIYTDSDVLFLGPVDDLWNYFARFNSQQVGALAPRVGWKFQVPSSNPNFIQKRNGELTQVNSGVFLMNLTRMRQNRFKTDPELSPELMSWNKRLLLPLYHANEKDMYGDQNLINVVFHYNPDLLYYLPCKFNYHHKFCFDNQRDRFCDSAEIDGAAIVHGSANTFYNNYSPAFAAVDNAMKQYNFEEDVDLYLLQPMLLGLRKPEVNKHKHCGGKADLFTRHLRKSAENKKGLLARKYA